MRSHCWLGQVLQVAIVHSGQVMQQACARFASVARNDCVVNVYAGIGVRSFVLAQSASHCLLCLRKLHIMALQAFLATVDSTRGSAFVDNIMLLLGQADVTEVSHLKAAKLEHFRVCFQITLAFCIYGLSLQGNAGQMGFISLAWDKCGGGQKDGFVVPVEDGELCDDQLQAMFLRALGKGEQKQEHVDIAAKLKAFGLFDHLPSEVWPPMNATHELQKAWSRLVRHCHLWLWTFASAFLFVTS